MPASHSGRRPQAAADSKPHGAFPVVPRVGLLAGAPWDFAAGLLSPDNRRHGRFDSMELQPAGRCGVFFHVRSSVGEMGEPYREEFRSKGRAGNTPVQLFKD
jgi:hypothetical protein